MILKKGDHVTVSGTVAKIENGCALVRTKAGNEFWINDKDIKTYIPMSEDESLDERLN